MASFCSSPAWAQAVSESAKLQAQDGFAGDWFGISVSITGDRALVGSFYDDDQGTDSGSAYVFARTPLGWVQETKLLAPDSAAGDNFGRSVSLEGDRALVGAFGDDDQGAISGSAYVFARTSTGWNEEAKLLPQDGAALDQFGISVSLAEDRALVGSFETGIGSGKAYVFARTPLGWVQEAKLLAHDGAAKDWFGIAVSLAGDRALVGSPYNDDLGADSGSAYVFARTPLGWVQEAKLLPEDGAAGDWFGIAVSLAGDRALVGSPSNDDLGADSGSAYVFARTPLGWVQEAKLLPQDAAAGDWFGIAVSLAGDRALVGSRRDDDLGEDSGSAYVFAPTAAGWLEEAKLLHHDGAREDEFGVSVSLAGDCALVGALNDDDQGTNSGSAYVFELGGSVEVMSECFGNLGLLSASGEPALGSTVTFVMDQGQVQGVFPVLAVSLDAIAGWPACGVPVPGVGEILVGITPPDPAVLFESALPWLGMPVGFPIPLPDAVSFVGTTVYVQGIFADFLGLAPAQPLRATNGIALVIGL